LPGVAATDQLVEIAPLSASRFVLHKQSQVALIELFKPLIPRYFFQRIGPTVAREIKTYHADVVFAACTAYTGWLSTAFLRPLLNLVVICQFAR
jgi:hypothetical protein